MAHWGSGWDTDGSATDYIVYSKGSQTKGRDPKVGHVKFKHYIFVWYNMHLSYSSLECVRSPKFPKFPKRVLP